MPSLYLQTMVFRGEPSGNLSGGTKEIVRLNVAVTLRTSAAISSAFVSSAK
jgi:hypothetical protein